MIVITNFDITVGYWMIGDDLKKEQGTGLRAGKRGLSLPSEASEWQYWDGTAWETWQTDPLLTVTGNILILRSLY